MTTFIAPYTLHADPEPKRNFTPWLIATFRKVLTPADQRKARFIMTGTPSHERNPKFVELLTPLMPKIDKMSGQENDVRFMAYGLEHIMNQHALDV